MKTIFVEPATVELNGAALGTVNQISVSGSVELFSTTGTAWVNMIGNGVNLASKSVIISEGLSASGANWASIESDILSQLGLTKAAEQNPAPTQP